MLKIDRSPGGAAHVFGCVLDGSMPSIPIKKVKSSGKRVWAKAES
jgi:hypothetical protein